MSRPRDPWAFQGLEEEARICARCGSCRGICPTHAQVGWESSSPRARVLLARELAGGAGAGKVPPEAVRRALECTLCGGCREACPAGIDTRTFLLTLRERLRERGLDPEAYRLLAANLAARGNVSPFDNRLRADWVEELEDPAAIAGAGEPAEVGYFVGCVSSFYPAVSDIPLGVAALIGRMGKRVAILGEEELCCGFPLLLAGRPDEARGLMGRNLERVARLGVRTLVTGCPSCYHTWTHDYPAAAGGPLPARVVHFTEYLLECLRAGALDLGEAEPLEETVTYHDPCDLGRNSGLYEAPRELLRALPGVRFVEMERCREEALCCGGGGNLQSLDPELTRGIAAERVAEARATGATVLTSACQQCVQVLAEAARRTKAPLRVVDLAVLWAERFE